MSANALCLKRLGRFKFPATRTEFRFKFQIWMEICLIYAVDAK